MDAMNSYTNLKGTIVIWELRTLNQRCTLLQAKFREAENIKSAILDFCGSWKFQLLSFLKFTISQSYLSSTI